MLWTLGADFEGFFTGSDSDVSAAELSSNSSLSLLARTGRLAMVK